MWFITVSRKHQFTQTKIHIMKKKLSISLILLVFSICVFAQYQEEIKKLDTFIKKGMKDWQVLGLAAVVVNNDEVIFKKTYGIKDIYSKEKVNEQTLFTMASTTKALIAISLGMLLDQEKISWDEEGFLKSTNYYLLLYFF